MFPLRARRFSTLLGVVGLLSATLLSVGTVDATERQASDLDAVQNECTLVRTQIGLEIPNFGSSLGLSAESVSLGRISEEKTKEGRNARFGLAVTNGDAERLDALTLAFHEDIKSGTQESVREAVGDSFSGMWISLERGGYILSTSDASDRAAAAAEQVETRLPIVEVVEARNSMKVIDTEYDKIRKNGGEIFEKAEITSGVVDVSCGLLIFNSSLDSATATKILEGYFAPGTFYVSPVDYKSSNRNKFIAQDPHVAGVNIRPSGFSSGGYCTTNNVWTKGSEVWLVTAAHCIPPGNVNIPANAGDVFTTSSVDWFQGTNNSAANRVSMHTIQYAKYQGGTDAVVIQARTNHRGFSDDFHWIQDGFFPYTTHFGDTQSWISVVSGAQWPWINYPICTSAIGAGSPHCGNMFSYQGTGVTPPGSGGNAQLGFTTWFHDMLHSYTYGCGGDSGGSGYYEIGGAFFLTGIVHGGPGNPCGPETYYSSVGWMHQELGLTKPYGM